MTSSPFSEAIELAPEDGVGLRPVTPEVCPELAAAIVGMAPWSVLRYPASAMARYLLDTGDGGRRYLVQVGGVPAGALTVRYPWLRGPYLELLALLPDFQGRGIGGRLLHWLEQEAVACEARSLWACASRFNERALQFYARHGFAEVAALPDLVADGFDEILLRRFPLRQDQEH